MTARSRPGSTARIVLAVGSMALFAAFGATAWAQPTEGAPTTQPTVLAPAAPVVEKPRQKAPKEEVIKAEKPRKEEKKKGIVLEAFYDDGLGLRTPGKTVELKIGASAHFDSRFYLGGSVAPHSFDIRRARLDFQGKFWKRLEVRLQAAFEDVPAILDAYGDVRIWNALHLRGGQFKVPFSTQWLTGTSHVDFLEFSHSQPINANRDRGVVIWGDLFGERLSYTLGVFTGAGIESDYQKGDYDNNKDLAWRLFVQPFRGMSRHLEGLYLVGDGTYGVGTVTGSRYERSMNAANYESQVFRWRASQVLGSNSRNTDQLSATYDNRTRWGAELHYLNGPFTFSGEWNFIRYNGLAMFHDFMQGTTRLKHDLLLERNGGIHHLTAFVSYFITGEGKKLDNWGWKQPTPRSPLFAGGKNGPGAFEVLGRFSATVASEHLFDSTKVSGFASTEFDATAKLAGPAVAQGSSVTAAFLDGAPTLYEATVGLNWTMNYHLRVQLNYVLLYAPKYESTTDSAGKTTVKNGLISGGNSDLYDSSTKSKQIKSEHMVGLRCILRI